jgi:hypothetical protein
MEAGKVSGARTAGIFGALTFDFAALIAPAPRWQDVGEVRVPHIDRMAAYVLATCQRIEREFTLKEIVARVQDERPDMIKEFAEAWGRLIARKEIRRSTNGVPSLYQVTGKKH